MKHLSEQRSNISMSTPSRPLITHCIDFLTYTVPYDVGLCNAIPPHSALMFADDGEVWKTTMQRSQGYDSHIPLNHGRVSYNSTHPEFKIFVRFSGRDLWELRRKGLEPEALLEYALSHNANITRMDFAVDYAGPSSPRDLFEARVAGRLRSAAKRHYQLDMSYDETKGEVVEALTFYLGSFSSPRWLRCYDKAVEQGILGPLTRTELVMKDGHGNRVALAMIRDGIAPAGKQAIRDFIYEHDTAWLHAALEGPSVYIETAPRAERDTGAWLLDQVLPSFKRCLLDEAAKGETRVLNPFAEVLQEAAIQRCRVARLHLH